MRTGRNSRSRKKDPRSVLFHTVVTILGVVFVVLTALFLYRMSDRYTRYSPEPDDILFELKRGDYVGAWEDAERNRACGITEQTDPDYALPYAVTDYYEAASYYTVYRENGDEEKAAVYRKAMDKAFTSMGELQFMAEEIDGMLGLAPDSPDGTA